MLTLPSARADMTLPRADRDLLMFLASSSTAPSAPVLLTCKAQGYELALMQNENLNTITFCKILLNLVDCFCFVAMLLEMTHKKLVYIILSHI